MTQDMRSAVSNPALRAHFRCQCFAVPGRLLRHLSSGVDEADRSDLAEQVQHMSRLRGQRASASRRPTSSAPADKPLHRQVFTAQGRRLLPGLLLRDEDDPPVGDAIVDQAYENIGVGLRFFSTVLGWDSVDGKGMRVDASVHYGFAFANAMWTGEQMIIGDGDGRSVRGLAGSLGIIAHELAHGVSQHLVRGGLGVVLMPGQPPALKGEAGALNESFSDVFASLIKQWHAGQTVEQADWLVGEDILAPRAGRAVRSLQAPGDRSKTWPADDQIRSYGLFRPTDDAHKASGIANHAFYLAAMDIGGHAWQSLAPVWFYAFAKLRARSGFLDAAHSTMAVAALQHGAGSAAHKAVKQAWRAVKVLP